MKTLSKTLAWLLKATILLLLLLVAASALIVALEIRVDLAPLRQPVSLAASRALDRDVTLEGGISLVPTLWPTLEIRDAAIGNPRHWPSGQFAEVDLLRLKLGLMPLLAGRLEVADATAEGVRLELLSNARGEPNWRFHAEAEQVSDPATTEGDPSPPIRFTSLDNLTLERIEVRYRDQQLNEALRWRVTELQGQARRGQPVRLDFFGDYDDHPYRFELRGGSLDDLRTATANWPLELNGRVVDTPVRVEGALIRDQEPRLEAGLEIGAVDVGAMLAWLGLVKDLELGTDSLSTRIELRGDSLAELLAQARFALTLRKAQWRLRHQDGRPESTLAIRTGTINVAPGTPLTIELDARVDEAPVAIHITGSPLPDYARRGEKLPLVLEIRGGGAEAHLAARVIRPIDPNRLGFRLRLRGERLDLLNALLDTDLPPLGPYSLAGRFSLVPNGYEIGDLAMGVGESRLTGNLSLDVVARPPRLEVTLHSKGIRLNDFDTGDWSALESGSEQATSPSPAPRDGTPEATGEVALKLLSAESLRRLDARIDVQVRQVRSGADALGRGSLRLELQGGKLRIDPVRVELPGGAADLGLLFHPKGDGRGDIAVRAQVEHFDYGVLARRIDPESDIIGHLSLDLDLSAHIADPHALLANAEGHLDFGLWPGSMDASLFDLWAVNLITNLMAEIDREASSKVNCIIAGFRVRNGLMQQKLIFADTSRIRITGTAEVDFRERRIRVRAVPKAKRPEFFNLAVPMGLNGGFEDFELRINPFELTAGAVQSVLSPLHVPIRRLFTETKAMSGKAACRIAWNTVRDVEPTAEGRDDAPADAAPGIPDAFKAD